MNQESTFTYRYSAEENKEIMDIRRKYLPKEENKFEELKRLDHVIQNAGMIESLCAGVCGILVFGLGMCLAMQVLGNGVLLIVLGILLGMIGLLGMFIAYPIYRRVFEKTKTKLTPRILELSAELSGEK